MPRPDAVFTVPANRHGSRRRRENLSGVGKFRGYKRNIIASSRVAVAVTKLFTARAESESLIKRCVAAGVGVTLTEPIKVSPSPLRTVSRRGIKNSMRKVVSPRWRAFRRRSYCPRLKSPKSASARFGRCWRRLRFRCRAGCSSKSNLTESRRCDRCERGRRRRR